MASKDGSFKKIKPIPIKSGLPINFNTGLTPIMKELTTDDMIPQLSKKLRIMDPILGGETPTLGGETPTLGGETPTLGSGNSAFYKPIYTKPDLSKNLDLSKKLDLSKNQLYRKRMERRAMEAAQNTMKKN